jgi:hypothetical protein
VITAICAEPLDSAVARCSTPGGTISGSNAATAGLSKAVAVPSTPVATNICNAVSEPE